MQLQQEYSDVLPLAQHIARSDRVSNVDAWTRALKKLQTSQWQVRKSHPVGAILPVFNRYAAWQGCSTSGQERTHAKQQVLLSKQRRSMGNLRERDSTKLYTDMEGKGLPAIIAIARKTGQGRAGCPDSHPSRGLAQEFQRLLPVALAWANFHKHCLLCLPVS